MAKKIQKISNKEIASFALIVLSAVVLVKIWNTADQYDKIAKKVNSGGIKSIF